MEGASEKPKKGGRLVKGSQEAKERMAYLRSLRANKPKVEKPSEPTPESEEKKE